MGSHTVGSVGASCNSSVRPSLRGHQDHRGVAVHRGLIWDAGRLAGLDGGWPRPPASSVAFPARGTTWQSEKVMKPRNTGAPLLVGVSMETGDFGIWQRASEMTPDLAREAEQLGFGTVWLGGSPEAHLLEVETILQATNVVSVATGIVNMWRSDARTVGASYLRLSRAHPGRFLLGVGIGHPESTDEYHDPYDTIVSYLDVLEATGVPGEAIVLAALGPRVLALAGERTAGAHPYLTSPRHTRMARDLLGEGPLLAPEVKVVLETDVTRARSEARRVVARYLDLENYRNSLRREGWSEEDLENGGSDGLLDQLVLGGDPTDIVTGIRAHHEAGADHVAIQIVGGDPGVGYRRLAAVLFD